MPKRPPTRQERTRAVVALLAAHGPLTVSAIARQAGFAIIAVRMVLLQPLFEREDTARGPRFGLNEAGRKLAAQLG